jgi:hypothetical protein
VALAVMRAIFWIFTQPVNKYWLKNQKLGEAGQRFFSTNPTKQRSEKGEPDGEDWKRMRDRWEYLHLVRALLSVIELAALTVAVAMCS